MRSDCSRFSLSAVSARQRSLWDDFVQSQPTGHLLQGWNWGELKAFAGWSALRVALWDDETQQMVAAAQVLLRSAPGLPVRVGNLAYIPKGPVLDWSQPALCEAFFTKLAALLRRQGTLALRVEPAQTSASPEGELVLARLRALGATNVAAIQPARSILLNLEPSEEELLAHMKEKWRYNIRLAGRKGVTVRVANAVEDVRDWYALLQTTAERDGFGVHTLDYYMYAWELLAPLQQARLLLAEAEGKLLAGIFVSLFANQAIYLYGASSNELRQLMPNYLLQWEAIRWAKTSGARSYDFWGIPETEAESEAMAGVYRFKRGWGGEVVSFVGCHELVYRPVAMRLARSFI